MTHSLLQDLDELQQRHLLRRLRGLTLVSPVHATGVGAYCSNTPLLLFCTNDYLGLSQDSRVLEAAQKAITLHGLGSGAARLISGTHPLHLRLESELASYKKKEAALLFGSGYLANLGVLSALAGEEDLIVLDKLSHASLIDGARLSGAAVRVFPHRNYARAEEILQAEKNPATRRKILVSDAVFSMDGDTADLNELARLKKQYDCLLVIDDAHGIGILGKTGRGATEGWEESIDVIVGTLSKSFGVFGGFAAASKEIVDYLINFSRPFIFATAPPPALSAAALESLRILRDESDLRESLWRNVIRVSEFLKEKDGQKGPGPFCVSAILPLMIGEEKKALEISEALLEKGILIPAIRYPSVAKGKARLRLSVSAAHTQKDLNQLFRALSDVLP